MRKVYKVVCRYDEEITIGKSYVLVSRVNVVTGCEEYRLIEDMGGVPGNMDSSVRRYHGWRGTTGNVSVYAHGLRMVRDIRREKISYSGERVVTVILGPDQKQDDE